ncbi:MAG: hypothetical protein JKX70_00035 [Phycisphaerales bacterium]|nr:hypothetical protein [Phycisphaerales bacterium]
MASNTIPATYILAGLLIPGTVMVGTRFFGIAPTSANAQAASIPSPQFAALPSQSIAITAQSFPSDHHANIRSPFWWAEKEADIFDDPFQIYLDPEPIQNEVFHEMLVTSILPHPKNPLAIINTKPYRIGDDLGNGWKLAKINGKSRTVTLIHTSGKQQTLSLTNNP